MRQTDWAACFRVSGAIESTTSTLTATAREFEGASDDAARRAAAALRLAEAALLRARAAVKVAISKQLSPVAPVSGYQFR